MSISIQERVITSPPKVIWEEHIAIHNAYNGMPQIHPQCICPLCASCAMSTADKSNNPSVATLHPHPGNPGQSTEGHKIGVCVCVADRAR